ncbi:PstS family phosphate ABC transporter substrate-binding protein [Bacillus sp. 2205SS5-2]|uniref:PstS family phosphate ABC transporter substrate-binding protein n=1 Tax=Bacillus sp. 2205SS5-2 TaxID=3109031 RepID=UPI003007CA99
MKSFKHFLATAAVGSALILGACGSDETENSNNGSDEKAAELQGEVNIDGSSTVYPIMEAIAEEYMVNQPKVNVTVGFSGTGGGFEKFIAGDTVISDASRPIKDKEKEALAEAGIDFTEIKIANDGLSVVINPKNDFVDYLTVDELKMIWVQDGTTKTWADIREEWPKEEIKFYSPGTDSGTFDYFNEVILEDEPMNESATLSEDDNVLVQGVTGDENAIGYFGYAYYLENKDKLKVVPIDNGEGAVEPTNGTVESGEYAPLSRPLFIYVKNSAVEEDEAVYDYVKFALDNAATLAEEVGYVRLEQSVYDDAMEAVESLR